MGEHIKSKAVYNGRNFDVGPWRDDRFIRCSRCGWINNLDRDLHSEDRSYLGWGTTFVTVTSTDGGSGFGTGSPYSGGLQTGGPAGQVMYSSSYGPTDTLSNTYGTFSFGTGGSILFNAAATTATGVMLLLYNANMYYINNSNQWYQYTGAWGSITADPRVLNTLDTDILYDSSGEYDGGGPWDSENLYVEKTLDAVVGGGCGQCGTYLYDK